MNPFPRLVGWLALSLPLLFAFPLKAASPVRVIDGRQYHLGTPGFPEWREFEGKTPHGRQLDLKFDATPNQSEATLLIRQRNVKLVWPVLLNGRTLGQLETMETELIRALAIPPGFLRDGDNVLSIMPPKGIDDIVVSDIRLDSRSRNDPQMLATIEVAVTDADDHRGLPCRLTITDSMDALVPLNVNPAPGLAVRTGVVYTRDGHATIGLRPGQYVVHAGRGFEYNVSQQRVTISAREVRPVTMQIRREVPTPGWIACDSHVHTLTYSGHGDATVNERAVTIAGEGIELAIATDHNHHTDYTDAVTRTAVGKRFRHVIGNEVTTKSGHFNAFPITAGAKVVDAKIEDWSQLMRAMRETAGVQVITLNHPHDLHSGFIPFGRTNFNELTGEHVRADGFGFDAIEVVTSGALQSDMMQLFRDWFALLNHGTRVSAIASSDSHDVNRFILGQGRTYVACNDADLMKLNLEEVWRSYREGRLLVSLGLLTQMKVNDHFVVGDLATNLGESVSVEITVLGPSWVAADRVELFANGIKIREEQIKRATSKIEKARVRWEIPKPKHDVHLVAIATGPGVTAPFWEIPRPYQPSSKVFKPRVLGATNPIWLDADGDGKFSAAREYAVALVKKNGVDVAELVRSLADSDEAVAVQVADVCQSSGRDVRGEDFQRALKSAPEPVQRGFAAFTKTLAVTTRKAD